MKTKPNTIRDCLIVIFCFLFILGKTSSSSAQCDAEVSGIFTYCNAIGFTQDSGYFVAFRVKDLTGDTLDVVDLTGQVPTNKGRRIDDINTQTEPVVSSIVPLRISGIGADTLEFWYFGPFANGTPFDIALVDPNGDCDTIFIASGTYDCADNTGISDPTACDNVVPLYFLDFSQTEFMYGGGGGVNENFDEIFLIMQRSRENFCCDIQPANQRCFEFIVRLAENDFGLAIDDVGSGSTAGEFYADTFNMFTCTGVSADTWPFTVSGGQSSDLPLCLTGAPGEQFVVLSCKSGSNVTGASIDAISGIATSPEVTIEPCNVSLDVFNADTVMWTSPDDPDLDNFISCNGDSTSCVFFYDTLTFGQVTSCQGDTFFYYVAAMPGTIECLSIDTLVYDTTYVVVYPVFTVEIDSSCTPDGDSLLLNAIITSPAPGCLYDYEWSTGDTTPSITVPLDNMEYSVTVTRSDLPATSQTCIVASDSIIAVGGLIINCENISDTLYECISQLPDPDTDLVSAIGCGINDALTYAVDVSNGGAGCINDTLIITRYYIIDIDGDTISTTTDRDSCTQLLIFVDDIPPVLSCPTNITVQCASQISSPDPGSITASDNCGGNVVVTHEGDVTSGQSCINRFTLTRTYQASDACGNTSTCAQIITVFDDTPPSITCPGNVNVSCASQVPAPNPASVSTSDNCTGTILVIHAGDVISNQTCSNRYTITRTYQAFDACNNSATCIQIITVDDQQPPSITCPQNVNVSCASEVPAPNTGSVITSDNCGGNVTVTHVGDAISNQTCANRYTLTRTYRATDECGNSATCNQIITVNDQTPPSITCPTNVTVSCSNQVPPSNTGSVITSDNCGGPVTVTIDGDVISGQLCSSQYILTRTYRATDVCGNSATCSQIITVNDVTPPTITCPVNVTVSCSNQVPAPNPGSVITNDVCGGVPTVTHVSDVTTNQTCANRLTITRTYRATDACGNSATCTQTITVNDQTPPSITCPANVTVSCASEVPPVNTGSVVSSDNCGGAVTITHVGDATTNQTCANRFTVMRTYRATDACGNSATCNQIITVNDQTPPSITCPPNITIDFGVSTLPGNTGNPTVSDNCGGTPVLIFNDVVIPGDCDEEFTIIRTWTATDACNISASCVQVIEVDGHCVVDLSLTKTLNAGQGPVNGGDNVNFTITITNEGEVSVSSVTITDYIPIGFTLNDPDWIPGTAGSTGQSASITLSIANGGLDPSGLDPSESASVQITLLADDHIAPGEYINRAEISTVIDLEGEDISDDDIDSDPDQNDLNDPPGEDDIDQVSICVLPVPVITGDPFVCPGEIVTYSIQDYNPSFTYNWIISGGGTIINNTGGTITIEWQNDEGGPFTIQVTVIIFQGCEATAFFTVFVQNPDQALACNDNIQVSLDGDCESVITPSMILSGQLYGENYIVIIYDQDGNIIPNATLTHEHIGQTLIVKIQSECGIQSCWGTVSVEDKLPPQIICACPLGGGLDSACQITCLEVDQLINGIIPDGLQPEVSDNCGEVTVDIIDTDANFDNCAGGFINVTWQATDLGGNTATCIQSFVIIPLTLDSLVFPPNFIGQCGSSVEPSVTGWPQVNGVNIAPGGLCNIFAGYWDKELNECGGGRKIVRTWTVLDWCTVQLVESTQIIKLIDDEGPVLNCPSNITVGTDFWYCYANVSVPEPIAYDNCSDVVSFHLSSSGGDIVSFGNHYVINGLLLGTYTVTWTVSDECGNSNSCSFTITVIDDVAPVANCDQHTIVALTNDGPYGLTLVPATVFNDGSYDNCGPVTFRARRMDSCIDFDWTTEGACIDDKPGGIPPINSRDRGTVHRPCVPFACCDVGVGPIMIELEVTDASGNVNYCMIEATIQDKISPFVLCPPDITVSCDFWFNVQEGTFVDGEGNNNGSLDEDPLSHIFGNMFDAFRYPESVRRNIVIDDPGNDHFAQPHFWGIDGWADDNCEVNLQVRVRVFNDCSGSDLPPGAPDGAVKLIERRFSASDGNQGIAPGTCTQRIWVVDYNPFYITDKTCQNPNPNDGVIWPCDVLLSTCPDTLTGTGEPTVFDDACSLIGVAYEDTRFDFVDGACFKILREWSVIDWCQYNPQTGEGLWHYVQVIKVHDNEGPEFINCPTGPVTLCLADNGVSLPDNNQSYLGEENPLSTSCSVHLNLCQTVHEACSDFVNYDVKLYLFNGNDFVYLKQLTSQPVDEKHNADLCFDTRQNSNSAIRNNGIPYNSPFCGDYHRLLWSAEDGCGNWSHCEYLIRLEDCKQPSPVCINGLSTVVMPLGGQVTIWAKDFDASSFDDCTPADELLFSFSGDNYQPSYTYTCDNVPAFGVELTTYIWVADQGTDDNCNGQISWDERNKDFCTTTIVIDDNANVCDTSGSILAGEILTDHGDEVGQVKVTLSSPGQIFPPFYTAADGKFHFNHLLPGQDYTITPERDDNHRNGVSTIDLVRIQKHLLGKELFNSPYQFIAADANKSFSVSAIDLVELRKLILGIYTVLPSSESWSFVDKAFTMADPLHPWPYAGSIKINQLQGNIYDNDFIGVKIGDVNNSAQANAHQILPRNGRRLMTVKAFASSNIEPGQIVELKLVLPEKVSGFQWTLETEGLDYIGVSSDDILIGDENVGLLENGIVTMSWNGDIISLDNKQNVILVIRWKATAPGKISKMVRMTSFVTSAESYTPSDEILDVKLAYSDGQQQTDFGLYQNKPNPWNGQTTIGFDLPRDDHARLSIFDVTGKMIAVKEGEYQAGYNTIILTDKEVPSSGVMYYRLESGEYSASKKMVLIR